MLKIWYRYIQKRPDVGFPYLGSWTRNNPREALYGASRALKLEPEREVAIERIDSQGYLIHYGWTPEWLYFLEIYPSMEHAEREWCLLVTTAFEDHRNTSSRD